LTVSNNRKLTREWIGAEYTAPVNKSIGQPDILFSFGFDFQVFLIGFVA
jgi:hypothetical protein